MFSSQFYGLAADTIRVTSADAPVYPSSLRPELHAGRGRRKNVLIAGTAYGRLICRKVVQRRQEGASGLRCSVKWQSGVHLIARTYFIGHGFARDERGDSELSSRRKKTVEQGDARRTHPRGRRDNIRRQVHCEHDHACLE